MIVVADAGPLIYLGGAGHLELLTKLYATVVVPKVVFDQVVVAAEGLLGAHAVASATWIRIEPEPPDPALLTTLDPGEAAAIPLASRLGATLMVDDAEARAIARDRRIPLVGTLGVLIAAKRRGLLTEVGPVVDGMERLGMFVSARLREEALRIAGE